PFYMGRTMVTRSQFQAALADERFQESLAVLRSRLPEAVPQRYLQLMTDPGTLPIVEVAALEAHCFAAWLGAELPTGKQWDKAAGRFDGAEGPFRSGWKPGMIALDRLEPGPVGTFPADESLYGCRDLAGNGRELTRDLT